MGPSAPRVDSRYMAAKRNMPWFRRLEGGGLEIFLKHGDHKVRAHGPGADMFELVEWFEDKTGSRIQGDWRRPPRRGPRPIPGQVELDIPVVGITELQSGESPPEDAVEHMT